MCVCESRVYITLLLIKKVYMYFQHNKNFKYLNKEKKLICYLYSAITSLILFCSQWKLSYNEADPEKDNEKKYNK